MPDVSDRPTAVIGAVVLAAGGSRRLGRPKQLVRFDGRPLVYRAAAAALAAGCDPVIVVLGALADEVGRAVADLEPSRVRTVVCATWRDGLSASLRCGVQALAADPKAELPAALVLLPCDQPELEPAVIRRLIEAWDGAPDGRVACGYADTVGAPALFGRALFPQLLELEGDCGAKSLLGEAKGDGGVRIVAWPVGARDVDRPEDL